MATHGERIVALETEIKIEIPAIKTTIENNHKELKEILTKNGNGKPKHTDSKWMSSSTKDFVIRWLMRGAITTVAGKSLFDSLLK